MKLGRILIIHLVLEDVENRALHNLSFVPIIYKRYVDDIPFIVPLHKTDEFVNTSINLILKIKITI